MPVMERIKTNTSAASPNRLCHKKNAKGFFRLLTLRQPATVLCYLTLEQCELVFAGRAQRV